MTQAYNPEAWHDFFVMLGGSIAALTGLLFVATSIHIDDLAKTPHWRLRSFGNIIALIGLLTEASVILIPQGRLVLGVELLVGNLFFLFFIPVRLFVHLAQLKIKTPVARLAIGILAWTLGALGGASLIVETGPGIYLIVISSVSLIWVCMLNAWSLMTASHQASTARNSSMKKIRSGARARSTR